MSVNGTAKSHLHRLVFIDWEVLLAEVAMACLVACRAALLCWERMNGQPVFGGRTITLQFCPSEPSDPKVDWR